MRAGGFPGNPGGLVVSILKTAGGGHRLTKPEAVDAAPGVRRSEPQGLPLRIHPARAQALFPTREEARRRASPQLRGLSSCWMTILG